ncbi:DinB family protein [Janibacter cremeus]|uniref:Putative damage-inducible protein DinB n=1 Tax=Janibacter cremeus TaxID=1285192 RepID=A0A852VPQ4_9MICO|nr:DinB family protein [Janibacter cremeus]NYF97879.1 putative damage-inducible protein DinB [Janibacter cremeus]
MTDAIDEHSRPEPPLHGSEWETLTGFLDYQRATLAWKTDGLDAEQLNRSVAATTMTLGGLIKHMAYVEDAWFGRWLWDEQDGEPWASVDWDADDDWDWHSAANDSPEQLHELWTSGIERSRESAERAVSDGGLGRTAAQRWPDGNAPSLRWILTHMIEEYARHNGHADLIRESIDGLVGE